MALRICFRLIALGVLTGYLASCSPGKQTLLISTGQPGGTYQEAANSLCAVIEEVLGEEVEFDPQASEGSVESMLRLAASEDLQDLQGLPIDYQPCDLALIQNDTRASHDNVRTILPLFEDVLHFIVPRESEIASIADLKGKRVAIGPPDSGTAKFVKGLFEHYGISKEDFEPQQLEINKACTALQARELDAVLIVAGFKPTAVEKLFMDHGDRYRFVSLGEPLEVGGPVDGFLLTYPFARRYVIPEGLYRTSVSKSRRAPSQPIVTIAVKTLLACRADLPEDLVFRITQAIVENRSELIHRHPAVAQISDRMNEAELAFPLHPGSTRFVHRHEPGFLVTYVEVMAFGLSLIVATVALLGAFRRWITMRKKDRIDRYYVRLNDLLADLQITPAADKLEAMEKEVSALRHQAFQELVDERLVANESFRIFQSLLSDCQRQIYALRQSDSL